LYSEYDRFDAGCRLACRRNPSERRFVVAGKSVADADAEAAADSWL
jgi:hypothetical protein